MKIGPIEYMIVGLGNPGRQYESTRHNAGSIALDYLAGQENIQVKRLKFQSLCGDGGIRGKRVLLLKPATFMNRSGEAVRDAMAFYKIPPQRVVVLLDDITLPVGAMRIRRSGSSGGQKGMENILYLTGSDEFPRIKIGVGHKPHPDMDLADWVLSRFSPAEAKALEALLPDIREGLELILEGSIEEAMNKYNIRGQGK